MSADPIDDALGQLQSLGLLVTRENMLIDGAVHRVDIDGHKRGKKNGWYTAHHFRLDDGREVVVGAFGIWMGADNGAQKLKFSGAGKISGAEKNRLRLEQEKAAARVEQERIQRNEEAAARAKKIWLKLPFQGASAYLYRKGVRGYGLRYMRGSIAIPVINVAGKLVGLQFIDKDGGKKYLSGTAKLGAWHLIGKITPGLPVVIVEGYATGASIHEATGWPVAICFDVANLRHVALAIKSLHPHVQQVIAGDDDHERLKPGTDEPENLGRILSDKLAAELRCAAVYPRFKDARGLKDWNDLHLESGLEAVNQQLRAGIKVAVPAGPTPEDDPSVRPWQKELVWTDDGLKVMVHNLMLVLEQHDAWKGVLAFDTFQQRLVKRKETPYGGQPGPMTDGDEVEIAAWFGRRDTYRIGVPTMMAREASIAVARRHQFHPVRDYLDGLKWDGTDRIPTFFSDFCGINQTELTLQFALNFFISCVARIYDPGCQARLMLVLEGEQNIKKSTLARVLCGEQWFADIGAAASDKDFYQIIQGRWVVEISELASFARAESSHIKRAISTNVDRFRQSYGRNAEDFPRQCIFFGTVNNQNWQKDETGGTRYMPLWVTEVNIDAIRPIRDQLWAEAVVRYRNKESWWELPATAKDEQDARYEDDVWTSSVFRWLEGKMHATQYGNHTKRDAFGKVSECSAAEILLFALNIDTKDQDKSKQTRIGNIMLRLEWKRGQRRMAGAKPRFYVRPAASVKGDTEGQGDE